MRKISTLLIDALTRLTIIKSEISNSGVEVNFPIVDNLNNTDLEISAKIESEIYVSKCSKKILSLNKFYPEHSVDSHDVSISISG